MRIKNILYPHKYRKTQYRNDIFVKCQNCSRVFYVNIHKRELKCPNCKERYNKCGYCGNLFKIRYIKCPSCNRYYLFRLVEVIFGYFFIITSIFCIIIMIIYLNIFVGIVSIIAFIEGYFLLIGHPIHTRLAEYIYGP